MPSKKRVLLVNPCIYDFKAYDSWMKPLGLLYIGSILEKQGYEVYLLDCLDRCYDFLPESARADDEFGRGKYYREEIPKPEALKFIPRRYKRYGIPESEFIKLLKSFPKPDVILVTSYMTYWYPGVFHAIKVLKNIYPGVPVILGGIYATLCFSHAQKYSQANYVQPGPFNQEALNLINKLTGHNPSKPFVNILSERPAYHLYLKLSSVSITTSLGCPFKCTYCASKSLQPEYIPMPVSEVVEEIDFYHTQYKIRHIAFYDDALLFNSPSHIEPILDKIISKNMDVNFYTPNGLHALFITKNLAHKMKKAGFKELRVSLETSDFSLQINTGGKVSNKEFEQAVTSLKDAGFESSEIGIYVMAGLPGQKYEDIAKTIEFVHRQNLKTKLINYSPIPGTLSFQKLPQDLQIKLIKEPLLQNDIAYLFLSEDLSWEKNLELKNMVDELNLSIK